MPRVVTPECANQKARSRRLKPTLYSKKSKVKLHAVCSTAAWTTGRCGFTARAAGSSCLRRVSAQGAGSDLTRPPQPSLNISHPLPHAPDLPL